MAKKKSDKSILDRHENHESYRNSQTNMDGPNISASTWTSWHRKTTHTLPHGTKERVAKKSGQQVQMSQGHNAALIQSRADYPEAMATLREMKRKPSKQDAKFGPIDPISKFDSAKDNLCQQHDEPPTGHATTGATDKCTSSPVKLVACLADQSSSWNKWWQSSHNFSHVWYSLAETSDRTAPHTQHFLACGSRLEAQDGAEDSR